MYSIIIYKQPTKRSRDSAGRLAREQKEKCLFLLFIEEEMLKSMSVVNSDRFF